jgi:hypothetical protein
MSDCHSCDLLIHETSIQSIPSMSPLQPQTAADPTHETSTLKGNAMSHRQQQAAFRRTSTLNLLLGALALGAATLAPLAQAGELDAGPVAHSTASRDQVRAEWQAAQRSGDFVVNAETGQTARQADPAHYAAAPAVITKSRREVRSETLQAIRAGDMLDAETGRKLNELNPRRYSQAPGVRATDTH